LGEQVGDDLNTAAELVTAAEAHLAAHELLPARGAADTALHLMDDDVLPELADEPWVQPARALRLRLRLRQRSWHASAHAALRATTRGLPSRPPKPR
jgi:hypothetical protein